MMKNYAKTICRAMHGLKIRQLGNSTHWHQYQRVPLQWIALNVRKLRVAARPTNRWCPFS